MHSSTFEDDLFHDGGHHGCSADGNSVIGYGFHSNGRYAQGGVMDERFLPRIREADPHSLINDAGDNLDPERIWQAMMKSEKLGGHGERCVAVGAIDMAVWDATAKIAGKPLFRLLAEKYGRKADPKVFIYSAGCYYQPGKGVKELRAEMRCFVDSGYRVVKMKIGNSIEEDKPPIEGVFEELGGKQNWPWTRTANSIDSKRSPMQGSWSRIHCTGLRSRATLWTSICRRHWLKPTRIRWRREKTYSATRTCGTCCATAKCARTRIGFSVVRQEGWDTSRCIPHGGAIS